MLLEKKKTRLNVQSQSALTFLIGAMLVLGVLQAPVAQAQSYSDWSAPINLGSTINSAVSDQQPAISPDGLSLYFTSNRSGGLGGFDLYVSQRATAADAWGSAVNIGPLNTTSDDGNAAFSRDGRMLFFQSKRPTGNFGGIDLWVAQRNNPHDDFGWEPAVNLGPAVNSAADDNGPAYFEDIARGTRQLYFGSTRPGLGAADIYVSERMADDSFGPATPVTELNSSLNENDGSIRHDGLEIIFQSNRTGSISGSSDLWVATRQSTIDPWSTPVSLGDPINTASAEQNAYLSSDGTTLFFASDLPGGSGGVDLYMSTRTLQTPIWSITGNLNTGRDSQTATLLPNGKVLVAGGNDSNGTLRSAELYDPTTGMWSTTGSLNTARAFHTATLLSDGKILVAGGFSCAPPPQTCVYLNSAELYDPATGMWSNTDDLNIARGSHTATLLPGGTVLVAGGFLDSDGVTTNSAELYNPATGTWSNTGNLNTGRATHTATMLPGGNVLVAGGSILVCGGIACAGVPTNSAEMYNPGTGTWSVTGNLNIARSSHTATSLPNGKVLVAGGFNCLGADCTLLNSAELYDPATGTWGTTGNLNQGRAYHTSALLTGGKALVAGGFFVNNLPNITNLAELYDPATGTWSNTATLNTARRFHTGTLLLNGKVLVAGGNGFNAPNSAELYDPSPPGPNTMQLGAGSYSVSEVDGSAVITVTRTGDTSGAATVNYTTSDTAGLNNCSFVNGVASARCDYIVSVGTTRFAVGETAKNISIPIVDDSFAEGNENFTITLSNASGATLGSPNTATVTIQDNEATNGANPIDLVAFFVRQQYLDFLNREPDPAGYAAWQAVINNCLPNDTTCDRIHVSSSFFRSAEFQGRGYFVYRFYPVAFGRKPDYDEFTPDIAKVSGFLSDAELEAAKVAFIAEFMSRTAFVNTYNGLSNTAYVDTLLSTAGITHPARAFWIAALDLGTRTRAQVLREIAESTEVYNKYFNQAFVVMQYFGYLRRQPDGQYIPWITHLDATGDFRSMINGFMNSAEYRARFGP